MLVFCVPALDSNNSCNSPRHAINEILDIQNTNFFYFSSGISPQPFTVFCLVFLNIII